MNNVIRLLFLVLPMMLWTMCPETAVSKPSGKTSVSRTDSKAGKNAKKSKKSKTTANLEETVSEKLSKLRTAYFQEQYASALVYCEQAVELIGQLDNEGAKIGLMQLCMELYDRNDRPEDLLRTAEKVRAMLNGEKAPSSLCFSEATALTKLHRWSEARAKYAECPGDTPQGRAVVESNVAELFMIEGDSPSAVKAYRRSLELESGNPHALFGLATALFRAGDEASAHAEFMKGVDVDPGFKYLEDAFFEPKAENDFQEGYRMYEMGRYAEARFYLKRYVELEERLQYKKTAQKLLDRLNSERGPMVASYPVLTGNVRGMAVDHSGDIVVFVSVERDTAEQFKTVVWVLDMKREKVTKRAEIPNVLVRDAAFVTGTHRLRVLTSMKRFELDIDEENGGYYVYDNNPEVVGVNLSWNGQEVIGITEDGNLTYSPWNDPWTPVIISEVPMDVLRLRVMPDHNRLLLGMQSHSLFVDLRTDKILRAFDKHYEVTSMAVHPSSKVFALGLPSGVMLVDLNGGNSAFYGTRESVESLSFTEDGKRLAVLSGQTLEIWDVSEQAGEK